MRVIDPLSGKEIAAHYAHLHTAWTLKWHPRNPEILASGSAPGMIVLWNVLDKRIESRAFVNSPEMINSIDFHPSDDLVLFCCSEEVYLWNYNTNEAPQRVIFMPQKTIEISLFAGGGELLLIGSKSVQDNRLGTIEEYLLTASDTVHVSQPITITTKALFLNYRGLSVSKCGMFLLCVVDAPSGIQQPTYGLTSYGPALDRGFWVPTQAFDPEMRDLSNERSFTRIMQQNIHADVESEVEVESSFHGEFERRY